MWSFLDMIIVVKLAKNKSVSIVMIHISMSLHTYTDSRTNSEGCFILFYIFLASNIIAQQVEKF